MSDICKLEAAPEKRTFDIDLIAHFMANSPLHTGHAHVGRAKDKVVPWLTRIPEKGGGVG